MEGAGEAGATRHRRRCGGACQPRFLGAGVGGRRTESPAKGRKDASALTTWICRVRRAGRACPAPTVLMDSHVITVATAPERARLGPRFRAATVRERSRRDGTVVC